MRQLKWIWITFRTVKLLFRKTFLRRKVLAALLLIITILHNFPSISSFNLLSEYILQHINKLTYDMVVNPLHDPWIEEQKRVNVTYYFFGNNSNYHYEFRYEFNINQITDDHRLMIFTCGRGRTCTDYWTFPVGRRIVYAMRNAGFSLLAICSKRRLYETEDFVFDNREVKWMYKTLQRWINTVFYQRFQRYPVLYIHGVSRGAAFAPLLARVLPIRALILTVYPGHKAAMTTPSSYSRDMQNRLLLDTTFANWFYFDYCYNLAPAMAKDWSLCPFENNSTHFYPIPPTYFVALNSDPSVPLKRYTELIKRMRSTSWQLGGKLLSRTASIMLDILSPANLTSTYMQENFDLWFNKPYASRIFFEYYTSLDVHVKNDTKHGTCRCSKINFTYWEGFPHIIKTWSFRKQAEHKDYVQNIKQFHSMFCEEFCGDAQVYHAVVSRNIRNILDWVTKMDDLRHSLLIQDYISRPLRIWMYRKQSIINGIRNFSSYKVDWTSVGKQYRMHTAEYLVQDYFTQLNISNKFPLHKLMWAENPLLADYFIVPHDLMYLYFRSKPDLLNHTVNDILQKQLNEVYFEKFLKNMRSRFPYWTMAKTAEQKGSNHIFAFIGSQNMGFLDEKNQKALRNVIQLVFTGSREDLLIQEAFVPYTHRDASITYRHGYDIVIPPFTNVRLNRTMFSIESISFHKKKHLFNFAGALSHMSTLYSASPELASLWRKFSVEEKSKTVTQIEGNPYHTLKVTDGHRTLDDHIESMLSSVFSICPGGVLPLSSRLYEAIQLGTVPVILADNVVLPFERFINWQSFTVKINVSNINYMIDRIGGTDPFKSYIDKKLKIAASYEHAFRWPYVTVNYKRDEKDLFVSKDDLNGTIPNVLHYIALEMRCRHLEQLYGFTSDTFSPTSIAAKLKACKDHPTICPCHGLWPPLAFHEHI